MKELAKEKYHILIEPLKNVKINTLFARSVIEMKVSGKVFIDDNIQPTTFYIIHPYGMTLLYGNVNNNEFNKQFVEYALNIGGGRNSVEWMQAFPQEWDSTLKEFFGDKLRKSENNLDNDGSHIIELNTRVNFKFNLNKYLSFKNKHIIAKHEILRTDEIIFAIMSGHVVPQKFWDNADDFLEHGVGFSLFHNGKLATTAFSSYIFDKELELGMETIPEFRGRGFAQYACSALIDYCLKNDYEPIWSCKYENTPSYQLAIKLGFDPIFSLPYYKLDD